MTLPAARVFITGASSGIGAALAHHYAGAGATVGLYARRADALVEFAATLAPAVCLTYAGDVRNADALAGAARDFLERAGVPDIVIANAGVSRGTTTEIAGDLAAFEAVFDTNVLGMVRTFAPFLASMQARRTGTLVGIASVAGFRGLPGSGAYSASKAAAMSYLESLRVELRGSGVRVVTICPGYVATPMTAHNPYRMPFLMDVDMAARKIARAIAAGRRFYVLPWQMACIGPLLRILPRPLYDALFAHVPRKPRLPD
jgi:short-subunit dehydrogenase